MTKKSQIIIEKVDQLDFEHDVAGNEEETEKAEDDFALKKWSAEVWSDIPELNKDFTMSNLSDQMFNSRVVNFIRNRILLTKLLRNIFTHAERKIDDKNYSVDDATKRRIVFETIEFRKCRNLILSEVYTILNLSKARGGLVLKAFLEGGKTQEEMEVIAGAEGPAIGEPIQRTAWERLTGKNTQKSQGGLKK